MKQIIGVFYLLNIWQTESTVSREVTKVLYLLVYSTFLLSLLAGAVLSDDRDDSIFLTAVALEVVNLLMKLRFILWQQETICAFIENIGTHSVTDLEDYLAINRKVNSFMKFVTVFFLMAFIGFTPVFIFCWPIFSEEKKLPLNIAFPLDWRNSQYAYWTAYVYLMYCLLFSMICLIVTVITWYLMMNCSIKYESLGRELRLMGISNRKWKLTEIKKMEIFFGELVRLIESHQNLKKYFMSSSPPFNTKLSVAFILFRVVDSFGSSFNHLFITQITTVAVIICGSLYVLAFVRNKIDSESYFEQIVTCDITSSV